MKQTLVIKVSMNDQKSRSKALKITVGVPGVESAGIKGADKSQIEVVGDGVDAVKLTTLLRKKVGHADLVSVSEKKPETKKPETKNPEPVYSYGGGVPHLEIIDFTYPSYYQSRNPFPFCFW